MKRIVNRLHVLWAGFFIAGMTLAVPGIPSAGTEAAEPKPVRPPYSFDAIAGYHHANPNGCRGTVGEYEVLDPGLEAEFRLRGRQPSEFDLAGTLKDKDDQLYLFDYSYKRIFQTETTYARFKHYLDHDLLNNQDYVTDFDAGQSNAVIREEFISKNALHVPALPGLKITADYREQDRRGHQQATTVSKCTQCHVTSRNRRINQTTRDIRVGTELSIGHLTLNYSHLQRAYTEGGRAPSALYSTEASSFPVRGVAPYSAVADARTYLNQIKAQTILPLRSALYLDYARGENLNRETRREREFKTFAMRLSSAFFKYVTLSADHADYDMDKTSADAAERDVRRSGFSFRTMSWKKTSLRGSYRWEDIDRRNSVEESTLRKILTLALVSRPHRSLSLNMRYQNELIDDPFVAESWETFRSVQTSLPTRSDEVQLAGTWNFGSRLSLSSAIRYEESESSRYAVDEERLEMTWSIWFAASSDLILTGSYSLIDADISTRALYKTYHRARLSNFLLDSSVPYEDASHCYNLNVNYRFSHRVALAAGCTYVDSRADFDSSINRNNVGQYSDESIDRLDAFIGLNFLYRPSLSLYTRYNYRDYDDRENSGLDGEAHILSCGVQYSFE
jgi:hypothetical protein